MLRTYGALALAISLSVAPTLAQEDPAQSRSTSFQAVEGHQREQVPGGPLVIYAYGFVLLSLIVYVGRLGLMHAKHRSEFERLSAAIGRRSEGE
jgi:hypothetical protein